jgi:hypothetical protein
VSEGGEEDYKWRKFDFEDAKVERAVGSDKIFAFQVSFKEMREREREGEGEGEGGRGREGGREREKESESERKREKERDRKKDGEKERGERGRDDKVERAVGSDKVFSFEVNFCID